MAHLGFSCLISLLCSVSAWADPQALIQPCAPRQLSPYLQAVPRQSSGPPPFLPETLFHNQGLNPNEVTFVHVFSDFEQIDMKYRGNHIGFYVLDKESLTPGEKLWTMAAIDIHSDYEGKGLGTLLYLFAAKALYRSKGELLHKSRLSLQSSARTWARLIEDGYAEELPSGIVRFKESALKGPALNETENFVKTRFTKDLRR